MSVWTVTITTDGERIAAWTRKVRYVLEDRRRHGHLHEFEGQKGADAYFVSFLCV